MNLDAKKCLYLINDVLRRMKDTEDADQYAALNKRLNLYKEVYYTLKKDEEDL